MATTPATAKKVQAPKPMSAAKSAPVADTLEDSQLVCSTDITPLPEFMAANGVTAIRQFTETDEDGVKTAFIRLGFSAPPKNYPFVTMLTKNPDGSNKGNNLYFAKDDSKAIIASGVDRLPAAGFAADYSARLTFNVDKQPRIKLFTSGESQYMNISDLLGLSE